MSAALYTLFTGRCPNCHEEKLFSGVYAIRPRCTNCGVVYMRDEGVWIGSTVVAYMFGSVWAIGMITYMWATRQIFEKGSEWIISGSTILFMLVIFRVVKAFWVGLLYDWGYVYADEEPEEEAEPAPT